MTTPNGAIVFNASEGDDTAASGLGPAIAQTGSGASTDGTAVVTGITTTGVSAGDLLWVQTASGRQFSIIASVDSGTQVTCDDTFVLGSSQTWAIGGKRATWDNSDSRQVFFDTSTDWYIATETDQTLTSALVFSVDNTRCGSDDLTTQRVITQTGSSHVFTNNSGVESHLYGLKLQHSNATKTSAYGVYMTFAGRVNAYFCTFGDQTNYLLDGIYRNSGGSVTEFYQCLIQYCSGYGVNNPAGSSGLFARSSVFSNNGNSGVRLGRNSLGQVEVFNSLFVDNGGDGLEITGGGGGVEIEQCVFANNTGDGVDVDHVEICSNSIFYGNGGYAINNTFDLYPSYSPGNAFGNTGTGDVATGTPTFGDITLTADPFTDAASGDYTINETSGGGAALRAAAVTLGSTESRPFRWLDNSTGGGGATGSSRLINGGLVD